MKLGQYFKDQCINQNEFARKVGVSPITIFNILYQKCGIQLATAVRIEEITEGKVTCRDLVNPNSLKTLELKAKHLMNQKGKK